MEFESRHRPAFLAVVPSGPTAEAWPVEVGWAFAEGAVATMCIAPAPGWSLSAWDKGSESSHRIALEELLREGKTPLDACLVLNAALMQAEVFVAAPERESLFLYKLYKAAGIEPNYRLLAAEGVAAPHAGRASELVKRLRVGAEQDTRVTAP